MSQRLVWMVALLGSLLGLGMAARAQTEPPAEATALVDTTQANSEYGGVVTAEVLTSMGHLFHAKFTEFWQTLDDVENFNVLVKERPYRRGSTEVQVVYGNNVVFRRNLPSNYSVISLMAAEAGEIAHRRIITLNFQAQLFRDVDMAPSGY